MKFRNLGQVFLALVVSSGLILGVTSCSNSYTVGFLYVTSSQYNQITGYKIDNNTGKLTSTDKSPYTSGGVNPIRALKSSDGRYIYVLNQGCGGSGQSSCASGTSATPSNISLFTIGGNGVLTFQQSFSSQGSNTVRIGLDTTGKFLYALDQFTPTTDTSCTNPKDQTTCNGDITVFAIDSSTGRLSLVTNQQILVGGVNLTYFPLGKLPIDFLVTGSYIYTAQSANQSIFPYAVNSANGQLTVAQNGQQFVGTVKMSVIGGNAAHIYVLDAGTSPSTILPFTAGSNGALQAQVGGNVTNYSAVPNPTSLVLDSKGSYLYITNAGVSTGQTTPNSDISGYNIDKSNGRLTQIASSADFGTGSGPQCILEDPSNQYFYTANFNDNTVTGKWIDNNTGQLNPLRNISSSYPASGQPTWCVVSGRTN